jgi:tetrahydromethanopterin S-methyltransferase subunit C
MNPGGDRGYPYDYNTIQKVVGHEMTRGMVMVPIATALAFIAMLLFIFGSYKMTSWADYVSDLMLSLVRS